MIRFGIGMYQSKNLSSILKKTRDSPAELLRNACQSYHGNVALKTIRADIDDIKDLLKKRQDCKDYSPCSTRSKGRSEFTKANVFFKRNTRTAFEQYLQGQIKTNPEDWPNLKFYTKSTEQSMNSQHGQNQRNMTALCRRFCHDLQVDFNFHVYYVSITNCSDTKILRLTRKKLLAKYTLLLVGQLPWLSGDSLLYIFNTNVSVK